MLLQRKKNKNSHPSDVGLQESGPTIATGNIVNQQDSSNDETVINETVTKNKSSNVSVNVEVVKEHGVNQNDIPTVTDGTYHDVLPIFLNEPFKNHTLQVDDNMIDKLNGDNWLCTDLIDFLVRQGLPSWKPAYVLVPTSDVEPLLDFYNQKAQSTAIEDIEMVANHRKLYKNFTMKELRILTITFKKGLFYVINMNMDFDAADADGDFFQNIIIYDSLVRSDRKRGISQLKNTYAIELLKKIVDFF